MSKKMLLLSNSTTHGYGWLEHAKEMIKDFFKKDVSEFLFIPYAAVSFTYDEYEKKLADKFAELGYKVKSIHKYEDKKEAVKNAEAIAVGGGNTYHLLKNMYEDGIVDLLKEKIENSTPYIGWSAGSNMACPTICTTNDMPIVFPPSFDALNQIPFQINPHYTNAQPEGHHGETRDQRITEYLHANKKMTVVGLAEGCTLKVENDNIEHVGKKPMKIFQFGKEYYEVNTGDDLSFLMK